MTAQCCTSVASEKWQSLPSAKVLQQEYFTCKLLEGSRLCVNRRRRVGSAAPIKSSSGIVSVHKPSLLTHHFWNQSVLGKKRGDVAIPVTARTKRRYSTACSAIENQSLGPAEQARVSQEGKVQERASGEHFDGAKKHTAWHVGGVLDKYLLKSMLPAFGMALALCAILGMSLGALVELIREVVSAGLPLRVAFGAALLQAPRFLSLALPLATLSGVLFGLGGLQEGGELGALASSGVSNARLLVAPLLLATLAGLLTLVVNEALVPVCSTRARVLVETALTTDLHTLKARDDVIYHEYGHVAGHVGKRLQRVWYAQKLEAGRMERVAVLDCSPDGDVHRVLTAGSCAWDWAAQVWRFSDTTLLHIDSTGGPRSVLQMQTLSVPMPNVAKAAAKAAEDLHECTRGEIVRTIGGHVASGEGVGPGSRAWTARCLLSQRDASLMTCAVYAMVGAAATLSSPPKNSRSDPYKKAAIALLLYNILAKSMSRLSQQGAVGPNVGAWVPPTIGLLGILFWAIRKRTGNNI